MTSTYGRSLSLFALKGIGVYVHWTFALLPLYIAVSGLQDGMDWAHVLFQLALVLLVFLCVVAHEFGHALTALHYGVRTRDITLYPIGGVASLERIPEVPKQELLVTLAGPAVNLAVALLVGIPLVLLGAPMELPDPVIGPISVQGGLAYLVATNLFLMIFNLIPAFPMDGGRILRSLLAMRLPRVQATRIAARVGRVLAIGIAGVGLYSSSPSLMLIGAFVFLGAGREAQQVVAQQAMRQLHVAEVMRTRFVRLAPSATVQQAAMDLFAHGAEHVVVMDQDRPMAVIDAAVVQAAMQRQEMGRTLHSMPFAPPPVLEPNDEVIPLLQRMDLRHWSALPVMAEGRLVGLLCLRDVAGGPSTATAPGGTVQG